MGFIASNGQFQLDNPVDAGALITSGFTVCQNTSLALGDTAVWYRCQSGTFYNLYIESIGKQCTPSLITAKPLNSSDGPVTVTASSITSTGIYYSQDKNSCPNIISASPHPLLRRSSRDRCKFCSHRPLPHHSSTLVHLPPEKARSETGLVR